LHTVTVDEPLLKENGMCHDLKHVTFGLLCAAIASVFISSSAHAAPILYLHDEHGTLAIVNASTGKVSMVGSMGVTMTDIAADRDGNLFGISDHDIYRIDRRTASASRIGSHGIPGANALTFSPHGSLYAAGAASTKLFTVDVDTGSASVVTDLGFTSAGDLAYAPLEPIFDSAGNRITYICGNPQVLFMASTGGNLVSISNQLFRPLPLEDVGAIELELATTESVALHLRPFNWPLRPISPFGPGQVVGNLGLTNMYGLANGPNGELFGLAGNVVYAINKQSGSASFLSSFAGQGLGHVFGATSVLVPEPAVSALTAIACVALLSLRPKLRRNQPQFNHTKK
jgi:hypothetical protein